MQPSLRLFFVSIGLAGLLFAACSQDPNGEGPNGEEECNRATCESLEAECGDFDNGCEGTVSCGDCAEGYECEVGVCVEICVPQTCESLGARCGIQEDGCQATIDCGPCGDCPSAPLCINPEEGTPDATVLVASGAAPVLTGGSISDGWYELHSMGFYTDGFLSASFATSVSITSNGNTKGSLEFWGEEWGLNAYMDLHIHVETSYFGPMIQDFAAGLEPGGCFVVDGNRIVGDLLQCGGTWIEGSEPPDGVDYEVSLMQANLLVVLPKEVFIAALPAEYQQLGPQIFVGDLPILMTFVQ